MAVFQSTRVGSFVESFKRPRQFAGSTPKAVLPTRDGKRDAAKCSAGEMLPVLQVNCLFALLLARRHHVADLVAAIDMLVRINRGKKVTPPEVKLQC